MSDTFNHEAEAWESLDWMTDNEPYRYFDDDEYYAFQKEKRTDIVCKNCGEKGFSWSWFNGMWRLAKSGEIHKCTHGILKNVDKSKFTPMKREAKKFKGRF